MAQKEAKSESSRRDFLKTTGLAAGIASLSSLSVVSKALAGKAELATERKIIEEAIGKVFVSAMLGEKGYRRLSLLAKYRELGGRNAEVREILARIDGGLREARAYEKLQPEVLQRVIVDSIGDVVGPRIGDAAAKGSASYQVRDSSVRLMMDLGGDRLKQMMTDGGFKIEGFNVPARAVPKRMERIKK